MKTSSAKNKGRTLQKAVANKLYAKYALATADEIGPEDFKSTSMGAGGRDIHMSRKAKLLCPFDIECKAQESLNVWAALEQTEQNTEAGRVPLLVFKRNRTKTYAVIEFEQLLKLVN